MIFLLALQFLTRFPVKLRVPFDERDLARSMACFPAVGLMLGASAAGVHVLLSFALSPQTCDLLSIAYIVAITGNMHLDGLMDTADGLFSGKPRDRMLEIMKDSRVGSHGVAAGILVLLFKFVLLGQLSREDKLLSLVLVPAFGRWAQVYAAAAHPYARPGGGTGGFTDHVGTREILWASVTILAALVILLGVRGVVPAGAVLLCTVGLGRYAAGKIGGMTGDTFGAISECIEVLGLVVLQIAFKL